MDSTSLRRPRTSTLVALAALGFVGWSGVQPASAQTLTGRILDETTGQVIPGATVTLTDALGTVLVTAVSDETGAFILAEPDPAADGYGLRIEGLGYESAHGEVAFDTVGAVEVDVYLVPAAVAVDPVVVQGAPQGYLTDVGFRARAEQGRGVFIRADEIEARSVHRITDLLRGRAGVRVVSVGMEEDVRVGRGGRRLGASDCQPAIWIDGSRVRSAGEPEVNRAPTGSTIRVDPALTELVSPQDIAGLELYTSAGGVPVQYRGRNADCGVVLIWSRQR